MKSIVKLLLLAVLCVAAVACGIPEEQYNAKVDEVNKLKKDLSAASQAYEEIQNKLNQMTVENQKMANRLQELGQNVQSLLGEKSVLASDLEATRAREARLRAEKEAQRQRMAQYRKVIDQFKELVHSGKLRIKIVDGQMVVQMASNILFDTGKANLSEEGEVALADLANILASIPGRKFQVAGHTDNVPISSRKFPSNWELSSARAVTVVRFLQENGVDPQSISAAGYAEFRPSESNDTADGQAANRRIEITLLPNLNELPDLSELEKELN